MSCSINLAVKPASLNWKTGGVKVNWQIAPELLALKQKYKTPKLTLETDYNQLNSYSRIARTAYGDAYRKANPLRSSGAEQYWPFVYLYNTLNCGTYQHLAKSKQQFNPHYLKIGQPIQVPPIEFINECISLVRAGKLKLFPGASERFQKLPITPAPPITHPKKIGLAPAQIPAANHAKIPLEKEALREEAPQAESLPANNPEPTPVIEENPSQAPVIETQWSNASDATAAFFSRAIKYFLEPRVDPPEAAKL